MFAEGYIGIAGTIGCCRLQALQMRTLRIQYRSVLVVFLPCRCPLSGPIGRSHESVVSRIVINRARL